MQVASILGLVIGLLLTAYAFYQDTDIVSRESVIYPSLHYEGGSWGLNGQQFFDKLMLTFRAPWQQLERIGCGLLLLSFFALVLNLFRKLR